MLVDLQFAAAVGIDSGGGDVELIAVGLASYGVEQTFAVHGFAAFQLRRNAIALSVEGDGDDFLPRGRRRRLSPRAEIQCPSAAAGSKGFPRFRGPQSRAGWGAGRAA